MTALEDQARDLDEIRRLGYMVLVHGRADGSHELIGTLANAMANHQRLCSSDEAIGLLLGAIAGDPDQQTRLKILLGL